jgi:hypothetical protein
MGDSTAKIHTLPAALDPNLLHVHDSRGTSYKQVQRSAPRAFGAYFAEISTTLTV